MMQFCIIYYDCYLKCRLKNGMFEVSPMHNLNAENRFSYAVSHADIIYLSKTHPIHLN